MTGVAGFVVLTVAWAAVMAGVARGPGRWSVAAAGVLLAAVVVVQPPLSTVLILTAVAVAAGLVIRGLLARSAAGEVRA